VVKVGHEQYAPIGKLLFRIFSLTHLPNTCTIERVFEDLARAIEELEVPPEREVLAAAFALRSRLDAALAAAVAAFRTERGYAPDGATSTVAWLRDRCGLTRRAAGRTVTVATRLAELPATWKAWRDGVLSEGQVEAIAANVSAATAATYASQEAELVPHLARLGVADVARVMGYWKAHVETGLDEPPEAPQHLHVSPGLDGRWELSGELGNEAGQVVATALRLAETPNGEGERPRAAAVRRAEALGDVCRFFLDHQKDRPTSRHRPHLNVLVDAADLAAGRPGRFVDGSSLNGTAVARLACDAAVHRAVVEGSSTILDYGTATRTIPGSLWNALVVRDEHCRFPGCDRPATWCDGHHVRWVERGGPTRLANLVLACRRHHHLLHTPGWEARLDDNGTLTVTDPYGRIRGTDPPRALLVC
jgi:Domain of unknown function (DUF222)